MGGANGALVAGETFLVVPARALPRLLRGVVTFHLILLGWVFFRAESLEAAAILLRRIWGSLGDLPDLILSYPFTAVHLSRGLMVGLLFIAEAASGPRGMADRLAALPLPLRWAGLHGGFVLLLLAGRWQDAEFIYAGF